MEGAGPDPMLSQLAVLQDRPSQGRTAQRVVLIVSCVLVSHVSLFAGGIERPSNKEREETVTRSQPQRLVEQGDVR